MEFNFEEDIKIEESALDVEWLSHGTLAIRYCRHAAKMRKIARLAEERVKVVTAELVRKANDFPEECTGKVKPNLQDIESFYRTHPDHEQAKKEMIDAQYEADYAEMAQKEISYGRKSALENLVVLHGAQYFAGPSMPRDLSKEWQKKQQQVKSNSAVSSSLRRTKGVII